MSSFTIKIGETFLAEYQHGGSLAGVTVTSSVRCDEGVFDLSFTVVDEATGIGRFQAATDEWPPGAYVWDIKWVGGGVTSYSDGEIQFMAERPVTP